jgi:hypothetical protein
LFAGYKRLLNIGLTNIKKENCSISQNKKSYIIVVMHILNTWIYHDTLFFTLIMHILLHPTAVYSLVVIKYSPAFIFEFIQIAHNLYIIWFPHWDSKNWKENDFQHQQSIYLCPLCNYTFNISISSSEPSCFSNFQQ